jgi:hypothetical protein
MSAETVRFSAPLRMWRNDRWNGLGYVMIEGEAAEAIRGHELMRRLEFGKRRGMGSVKVTATVGASTWQTSVFPPKDGGWFMPVKRAIVQAEDLAEGESFDVELELL